MNCPKCKNELIIKKTLSNGLFVGRERYCEKCKKSYWTVETFNDALTKEKESHQSGIVELTVPKRKSDKRKEAGETPVSEVRGLVIELPDGRKIEM